MNEDTTYICIDSAHDVWRCALCGYITRFEADGPTENGWRFCAGCGRAVIPEEGTE